jgi:hypothetical protein
MAKKNKGVLGAMGNLIRWTIWGLAGVLAVAVYLNFTKTPQSPGGDEIAVLSPADIAVSGASEEVAPEEEAEPEEAPSSGAVVVDEPATDVAAESETASAESGGEAVSSEVIRIPGDDATYTLLSAFRRDDGAIEITTERVLGDDRATTIRLIRCAPLEVGLIAKGDGPRNDAPEMVRITLGDAAATLAATACGAMK